MNEANKSVSQSPAKVKVAQNDIDRFWSKVKRTESIDDCWVWLTGKDKDGYGRFWLDGNTMRANRASWFLHNGDISEDADGNKLFVCHKCDNPSCVNPNHLFLGTSRDNINDMLAKGRTLKGEVSNGAVLKQSEVEQILSLYSLGNTSSRKLAKQFNVSKKTILSILNGKTWNHLHQGGVDNLSDVLSIKRENRAVSSENVLKVYDLYFTGNISARKIAGMFGVAKRTILSIINGNYASKVPLPPHIPSFDALRQIAASRRLACAA